MKKNELLKIFKETGVLLEGHFLLSSGYHSNKYLQCAKLFQYPQYSEMVAREIIKKIRNKKIDVVIGPALGGVILSYEVARQIMARGIFTEREQGVMKLRRGFEIKEKENVLIVEDVITTGSSTKEVINIVEENGGIICAIVCIVNRSGGEIDLGYRVISLIKLNFEKFSSQDCPLCKTNIPLYKPGSRK